MKKNKFILLALLMSISISAQIKLAEEKPPKEKEPFWWSAREVIFAPYDSSYYKINVYPTLDAYKKYIGQLLFLPVTRYSILSYISNDKHLLFSNKVDTIVIRDKRPISVYLYKYREGSKIAEKYYRESNNTNMSNNSKNVYHNKYYKIIDFLNIDSAEYQKHSESNKDLYDTDIINETPYMYWPDISSNCAFCQDSKVEYYKLPYFILQEKESGDTVYTAFPREFILVAGFVKMQQEFIGKNIFEIEDEPSTSNIDKNLIKGKWKCTDVVLREGDVNLILQNEDDTTKEKELILDKKILRPIGDSSYWHWITESEYNKKLDKVLTELSANEKEKRKVELQRAKENVAFKQQLAQEQAKRKKELTAKFGATTADKIITGEFEIGMSKAVCKEIAGYATVVERTETTEIWKVSNTLLGGITYLTFSGGKLVRIVNR